MGQLFARRPSAEWADHFFAARIPAATVHTVPEALEQPLAAQRTMVETVPHPRGEAPLRFLGNPFKFAGSTALAFPPAVGVHTREVLREVCQYDDARLNELIEKKAIYAGEDAA